ncbi:type IV pilus assembly protein PilE [Parelusimicrobium proximum]|uniref:type IV pilin protein n=1 Tax=Parelusimicrobium proximum TaxID=3228953 RepID=UPI003D1876D7
MRRGFTLIELLVVVLIIAILAAVALPQYTAAVLKSKVSGQLFTVRAVYDANQRYYLANDVYTDDFNNLDVGLPAGGALSSANTIYTYSDGSYFRICKDCGYSVQWMNKGGKIYLEYYSDGRLFCWAKVGESNENKACMSISGLSTPTNESGGVNNGYAIKK